MTQGELACRVYEKTSLKYDESEAAVRAFFQAVTGALAKRETVRLRGFGIFETSKKSWPARRNNLQGGTLTAKEQYYPKFRAAKEFKNIINAK